MNLIPLLPAGRLLDRASQTWYRKYAATILRRSGVQVDGLPLWVSSKTFWDLSFPGAIRLGDRCVISHDVRLLTHDFSLDRVYERLHGEIQQEYSRKEGISIGAQSFIGMGAIIMPGVSIGDGAIVGAGSVVTRDVAPDTVVAGNPAKLISTTQSYLERKSSYFTLAPRRR